MIRHGLLAAALLVANFANAGPAYLIAELTPHDREAYQRDYASKVEAVVAAYGGRYIARGGRVAGLAGAAPTARVIIIEFPSMAAAQSFWDSPEYRPLAAVRGRLASGRIFMVEGLEASATAK